MFDIIIFWAIALFAGLILFGFPVHLVLFGANRIRARKDPAKKKYRWSLLIIHLCLFFLVLLVAVGSIPEFLHYKAQAKQTEAKSNLGAIYVAYQAYYDDHHTFPTAPLIRQGNTAYNCLKAVGWEPNPRNIRYTYVCMGKAAFWPGWDQGQPAPKEPCPPGIITGATRDSFTIAACGDIDNDGFMDVWTFDDAKHLKNVMDDVRDIDVRDSMINPPAQPAAPAAAWGTRQ